MYDIIAEVIFTDIKSFEIKHIFMGSLDSLDMDGTRHIKELPYLSAVEPLEGSYTVTLGETESFTVRENEFFCAPAHLMQNIVHHSSEKTGRMRARWIFLDCVIDSKGSPDALYSMPYKLTGQSAERMDGIITKIFFAESDFSVFSLCCEAVGLLVSLSKPKEQKQNRTEKAVKYIRDHYAEQISPEKLAKLMYVSVPRLYALFAKEVGMSPAAYINDCRLTVASAMLLGGDCTVSAAASAVGFSDPLYFSRLFKKKYGVPPSRYN